MKKYISFILIAILTFSLSAPVYASATPSNASLDDYLATYEKIPLPADNPGLGVTAFDEEWEGDDGNLVASDSDWTFKAPAFGAPIYVPPALFSSSDTVKVQAYDGALWFGYDVALGEQVTFPRVAGAREYKYLLVTVPRDSLPSSGTYKAYFALTDYIGTIRKSGTDNVLADSIRLTDKKENVMEADAEGSTVVNKINNTWDASANVYINNNTDRVTYIMYLYSGVTEISISVRQAEFQFTGKPADIKAPSSTTSGDSQDVIADSSSQIAQNTASMSDTLKEIVQTISKQLEALWNQMYNYIHLEDMANADKNADKIVNALGNEISVQIENDNRITDEIIENDDKNTDTIVNGYDGSGIDADNSRLDSSINEYEEAESQVLDKVNDELGNFQFSDSIDSYVSAVSLISGFLQDIYDNSGGFKDVINIGFFLSIASIVIGMYRFKEG